MQEKLTAIIIDDENLARQIVGKYLEDYDNIELLAACTNGFEGIKKINEVHPDLVFLDIQMPKINGFEMLELIEEPPVIIFTTAYDQYAIKAFEVNAADYLLKPFSKERFDESIEKAKLFLRNKSKQIDQIKKLISHNDKEKEYLERIIVKDGSNISIIPVDEIKYIEARDDYVMIYSGMGKFLKQKTMKFMEMHLNPKDFVRIHRSYISSVKEIEKMEQMGKDSYILKLKDLTKPLPVSKSGFENLKKLIII
ncbi:MAG: response regulator [Ignavibacteriaceae bacterium]